MVANVDKMAFRYATERDIPWHGIGTRVTTDMDVEEWEEASGLKFRVGIAQPYIHLNDGSYRQTDNDFRAIVRADNFHTFGFAKKGYTVIQNHDALQTLAELDPDGRMPFETMGSLGEGEVCWALAKGDDYMVAGVDKLQQYILFRWGHDGSTPFSAQDAEIRVVCQNTLTAATHGKKNFYRKIRHTESAQVRLNSLRTELGFIRKDRAELLEKFEMLAQTTASQELREKVVNLIVPEPDAKETERQRKAAMDDRLALWRVMNGSETVKAAGGVDNRWGLYNAVTEYIDWVEDRKGQNPDSANENWKERRTVYITDGLGADRRQTVFDLLTV